MEWNDQAKQFMAKAIRRIDERLIGLILDRTGSQFIRLDGAGSESDFQSSFVSVNPSPLLRKALFEDVCPAYWYHGSTR